MVDMLKNCTQTTTFYKVKAHTNIEGNEQADVLAKNGIINNTDSLQNHTSLHIPLHITFIKIYGQAQQKDQTKAKSNAWKHTSKNTTEKEI